MDMDENLQNIQIERYFNGTSFPKSTSSDARGHLIKRRINTYINIGKDTIVV